MPAVAAGWVTVNVIVPMLRFFSPPRGIGDPDDDGVSLTFVSSR
jgi:hypothetical protein